MRNPIALVLAIAMYAGQLGAQSFFVGMRAGQASAKQFLQFSEERFQDGAPKGPNVTSGFSATLELKSWLAVESDLMLVGKGIQQDPTHELSLGYVEMPLLLRLASPVPALGMQLFVHGGPAPSMEFSCSGRVTAPVGIAEVRSDLTLRAVAGAVNGQPGPCAAWRDTKRDFGWVSGGGVLWRQPAYQITVSMRRTTGVRDLLREDPLLRRVNETRAFLISVAARMK